MPLKYCLLSLNTKYYKYRNITYSLLHLLNLFYSRIHFPLIFNIIINNTFFKATVFILNFKYILQVYSLFSSSAARIGGGLDEVSCAELC